MTGFRVVKAQVKPVRSGRTLGPNRKSYRLDHNLTRLPQVSWVKTPVRDRVVLTVDLTVKTDELHKTSDLGRASEGLPVEGDGEIGRLGDWGTGGLGDLSWTNFQGWEIGRLVLPVLAGPGDGAPGLGDGRWEMGNLGEGVAEKLDLVIEVSFEVLRRPGDREAAQRRPALRHAP